MTDPKDPHGAPRRFRKLLFLIGPRSTREFLVGDLDEAFVRRRNEYGDAVARRWYRRQVLYSLPYIFRSRLPGRKGILPGYGGRGGWLGTLGPDVRFAVRSLRRNPLFAVASLTTLTLGIGSTVALFTIVNAVLLRPPLFEDASRVVRLYETRDRDSELSNMSYPDIVDVRERSSTLLHVAAKQSWSPTLLGDGDPVRLDGASVSANFFSLLGVAPAAGRFFTSEESETGHEPVVVLSHHVWSERLGAAPDIVGRSVDLSGVRYTVVGVAPVGFEDPDGHLDIWRARPPYFDVNVLFRTGHNMRPFARMASGVTLQQVNAELAAISAELLEEFPDEKAGDGIVAVPIMDVMIGGSRVGVLTLFIAVCVLLLIASSNVANLLLSRATVRRGEIAVRTALGASMSRIVSQLLVESMVLSATGTILGLILASTGVRLFVGLGAAVPRAETISIDAVVIAFAIAVSFIVALLFGIAPALQLASPRRIEDMRAQARQVTVGNLRFRNGLVVTEVALALTLLMGAGLLLRSLTNLTGIESGIRSDNILTMNVTPAERRYAAHSDLTRFWEDVVERVDALPGVVDVGAVSFLPMTGGYEGQGIRRTDRPPPAPSDRIGTEARAVTPRYFQTIGITVIAGRGFLPSDDSSSIAVAVINQSLSRLLFPGEDPLGKRVNVRGIPREIVGVVSDVRQFGVLREARSEIYAPHAQVFVPWIRAGMDLVVQTGTDPLSLSAVVQRAIWETDATVPITDVKTMARWVSQDLAAPRVRAYLLGLFSAIAALMAAVGIGGVLAYTVNQRRHEFGVRMALGAGTRDLMHIVWAHGAKLILVGVTLGTLASYGLNRFLESILFGISSNDPMTFGLVVLGLAIVGLLAASVPAFMAGRVAPGEAMRVE